MNFLKRYAKTLLENFGYELRETQKGTFPSDPFQAQLQIIKDLKRTNISIFDVGANKGQTASRYRAIFPDAEIFCFEPFPECVADLQNRFRKDEKLHIVPKAVGRQKGTSSFYVNEYDATNSLLPRPVSERRYYPKFAGPKEKIDVEVIDLDGYVSEQRISNIEILKFDIQGGELGALHGSRNLLAAEGISLVYTEIMFISHYEGGAFFHEIASFLSDYGYSLFDIYDLHRATNGQLRYGDALFVSSSIRKNVIDRYTEEP